MRVVPGKRAVLADELVKRIRAVTAAPALGCLGAGAGGGGAGQRTVAGFLGHTRWVG